MQVIILFFWYFIPFQSMLFRLGINYFIQSFLNLLVRLLIIV